MHEKIMVSGHLCLDITPRFPAGKDFDVSQVFSPGQLTNVEQVVLSTGGCVSNTGLALAKLGFDVLLNGKTGDDAFGNIIRGLIAEQRDSALRTVPGQASSYTIVLAPPGVDRFFLHYPATNDTFGADDIDYKRAKACKLFHFGYPPLMKSMFENQGRELVAMYRCVKQLGVTTSLDMAMPDPASSSGRVDWKLIIQKVAPYVDIFLPSIEEIAFMLDRSLFEKTRARMTDKEAVAAYEPDDFTRISEDLLSMGVKMVLLKCGIKGLYLRTGARGSIAAMGTACPADLESWADREIWAASFKTENFVCALGAGDATIAGFLCGLIRGFSPEQTLQIANTVGWQNVQALDALSGIRDFQGTIALLKDKNRPRNSVELNSDKWDYSPDRQVYYGPGDRK